MKKEIDRNIYEATLDYLNDRIDLYMQFREAAKSEDLKKTYDMHIRDCNEINEIFKGSFKPRRKSQTE